MIKQMKIKEADSQNSLSNNSNQQFPPRNAQRRKDAESN